MVQTKDIFGKRLLEIRESRGESQQELADSIGITRQSLSRYELGERTANIDLLKKVAKHYNVSTDYLLGLTDNATTDTALQAICEYTGLSEEAVKELHYEFTTIFPPNSDELYDFKQVRDFLIENAFLELFGLYYSSLFNNSKSWTNILKQHESKKASYPDELEFKCDVDRYNIIKLSEKFSNRFDMRELWEDENSNYDYKNYVNLLNKHYCFYAKEQVQDNGEHNPPKE